MENGSKSGKRDIYIIKAARDRQGYSVLPGVNRKIQRPRLQKARVPAGQGRRRENKRYVR